MVDSPEGMDSLRRRERTPSKGDRREEALLNSLENLLREHRIADINIDMIAGGAGVKRPAFYVYFETKYAALAVALDRVRALVESSEIFASIAEPLRTSEITDAMRSLAAVWRDHADLFQAAIEASSQVPELDGVWTKWVEGFVDAAAAAQPHIPNAESVARVLVWANERTLYQTFRVSRSDETVEDTALALAAVWIATLHAVEDEA